MNIQHSPLSRCALALAIASALLAPSHSFAATTKLVVTEAVAGPGQTIDQHGQDATLIGDDSIAVVADPGAVVNFMGGEVALPQTANSVVADGVQQNAASGLYETVDDGAAGYAFHALNAGSIVTLGPVALTATGDNTSAARAESGGSIVFNGGDVTTTGNSAAGLSVATGGRIELLDSATGQGVTVNTAGTNSNAAQIDNGVLIARDAVLQTSGMYSNGIDAVNGSTVEVSDSRIHTAGRQSHGISVANASATLRGTHIETDGISSDALLAKAGGRIDGDGLSLITNAYGSGGANVAAGGTLSLTNSLVETSGGFSTGVRGGGVISLRNTDILAAVAVKISNGGVLSIDGGLLQSDAADGMGILLTNDIQADVIGTRINAGGYGVNINGARNTVRLTDVDITASGPTGTGIWLPDASTLTMLRGSITTTSGKGVAIDNRSSSVSLDGLLVDTAGSSSHGLYASMDTGRGQPVFEANRVEVRTTGDGGIGAVSRLGGTINLRDSSIVTTGTKSYGVLSGGDGVMTMNDTDVLTEGAGAWAGVVNANGSLDIDGGSLVSAAHGALWVRSARHVSARNGARLIGGNGTLMAVDAAFATPFELSLDQDVYAEGDIVITPEDIADGVPVVADINVRLKGRSHWLGASTVVNQVALSDDSRWTLTGDSTVGQLDLRDSTLELSASGATNFNRLTVNGDFESSNGLLVFNGQLSGDDSLIDSMHVRGDTRGTAGIQVNNVHGLGGQTVNGIQLIQVDGASDAVYTLKSRAVAGRYDYFLHHGGKNTPDDGGWYLRSEQSPIDPCVADPDGPGCVVTPPNPCESDPDSPGCVPPPKPCELDPNGPGCVLPPDPCEVENADSCDRPDPPPILRPEAGAYLANQAAATQMFGMRLHDRTGGTARGLSERGAWVRVVGNQADYGIVGDQLSVKGDTDILQIGTDVVTWGTESRGQFGVMLGSGRASNTVTSRLTGYSAKGKVEGQAVGLYGGWLQNPENTTGLYVDTWAQYAKFKNTVQGDALAKERYDSDAASASIEAGYSFKVLSSASTTMFVEPQLQLSYTNYGADHHVEENGTVIDGSDAGGLTSRVGVRVFGHANANQGNRIQPFVSVNWIHGADDNSLRFDSERMEGGLPKDRYEAKLGAQLQLGQRWTAWGDLGLQRGDDGYRSASAQVGLKASW